MYFYGGDILITIIVKVLHLLFLYILVYKIHSLCKQRHIPKVKNEIILALIYLQIVLGMIMLLPPLVRYILSGFRMGIYSYLELLLITKIIILYKEKKELGLNELLKIGFLTIIILCWRTEGFYIH